MISYGEVLVIPKFYLVDWSVVCSPHQRGSFKYQKTQFINSITSWEVVMEIRSRKVPYLEETALLRTCSKPVCLGSRQEGFNLIVP